MTIRKSTYQVIDGSLVRAKDVDGVWHEAIAESGVEGVYDRHGRKQHDFPVIWIRLTTRGKAVPWPAQDVRLVEQRLSGA